VALIRGGGSKADLECFNNYDLAYYITQFPLPVLTGIGHERDESVTDLVAAVGLKTPTAVAEYLVDRLLAFDFRLTSYGETLSMLVNRAIQDRRLLLERQAGALSHLSRGFLQQKLASLEKRTIDLSHHTRAFLVKEREMLGRSALLLRKGTNTMISRKRDHLALLEARNNLVNPENILKRGYSITLSGGRIIRDTRNVMPGDMMETRLHEGSILSKVEKTTSPHGKGKDKLR
jgi:exodeoxyribonuclease VII large subunit